MPLLLSFVSFLLNPFYLQGQRHHGRSRRKIYYSEERFGEHVTANLKPGCEEIPVTKKKKKDYVDSIVAYRISRRVK